MCSGGAAETVFIFFFSLLFCFYMKRTLVRLGEGAKILPPEQRVKYSLSSIPFGCVVTHLRGVPPVSHTSPPLLAEEEEGGAATTLFDLT